LAEAEKICSSVLEFLDLNLSLGKLNAVYFTYDIERLISKI